MTAFIYVTLFILMLFSLYYSGKRMSIKRIGLFKAAALGIIIFTLNEGLRFGRGIDYNYYAQAFNQNLINHDSTWDPIFLLIANLLGYLGIPWQGYVILMSFTLIVSCALLLDNFREVGKWAFPLFAIFALPAENLMRWFFGFSFILIGVSYLLKGKDIKRIYIYGLFSLIAFLIHFALLPIAIIFYIFAYIKKPIIRPIPAILLFFIIGVAFKTSFMEKFVDLMQLFSISERAESYQYQAEYWLTSGFAGVEKSPFPKYYELLLFIVNVYWGYKLAKTQDYKYTFVYNIFLIGFITYPICHQIELLTRFNNLFCIFQFVILAYIIRFLLNDIKLVTNQFRKITVILSALIVLNFIRVQIFTPFADTPNHFLYIWDKNGREYLDPYIYWIKDMR